MDFLIYPERKRTEQTKNAAMRELSEISNQMSSSFTRVRKTDVDDAKHQAAKLAEMRDAMNDDQRREDITKEIRVQEDKLKSISASIEYDMKVRDHLRLQSDQQNEIDLLEKQVTQEYEVLEEKMKDNSFLLSSYGEQKPRITKEDPVSPLDVLANNVRRKHLDAEDDVHRCNEALSEAQMKLSEKKALLGSHRQRLQQLQHRANQLNREEGGVQKILRVIRAIIRFDKTHIDTETINEYSTPSEVLKYLTEQINELSVLEEKPEVIIRIIKRLKKMVSFSHAPKFFAFHRRYLEDDATLLICECHCKG